MTDAELKKLAWVVVAADIPALLTLQDSLGSHFRLAPRVIDNGNYIFGADLLKELQPGGLYPQELGELVDSMGDSFEVVPFTDAAAALPSAGGRTEGPVEPWVQPLGSHDAYPLHWAVSHNGFDYRSLVNFNVWEPSPQSTLWAIFPDPGPLPWVQPTGAANAYAIGAVVSHTVPGRDITIWRSNIAGNTTEPGGDGTFDRWWAPLNEAPVVGPQPWRQPVLGAWPAYQLGAQVTHQGSTWTCTFEQNVWEPGVFGWDVEGAPAAEFAAVIEKPLTKKQRLASKRVRTRRGEFLGDDPATSDTNEAWLDGEAPA